MNLSDIIQSVSVWGDTLEPQIEASKKYKHWVSIEDLKRCYICSTHHGKIYLNYEQPTPEPPIHPNCRCSIQPMQSIVAGTATIKGHYGADYSLKHKGKLPNNYITKSDLKDLGWKRGKNISNYATGKLLTKGVYRNANGHLPQDSERIWYEADINYKSGRRNSQRILWSNDGLIFVTYDHYETFYEII